MMKERDEEREEEALQKDWFAIVLLPVQFVWRKRDMIQYTCMYVKKQMCHSGI